MDLPNQKRNFGSIYFSKDELKNWNSTKRYKNSSSMINSNLELAMTNSRWEYSIIDSTPESVGVDFELFKVEASRANSSLESTHQDSIPNFVGVIMIGYVFIQINKPTPKGNKSICIFKMVCTIGIGFKHLNFGIKEEIVHLVSPLSFQYRYVGGIFPNSLLVKMKGNIDKEMEKKMKRKESLESKLRTSQIAQKL
jgi:hypothetical protein